MILNFTDNAGLRWVIDTNSIVAVIYDPEISTNGKIKLMTNGGSNIIFDVPDGMDIDLVIASIVNQMKRGNQ